MRVWCTPLRTLHKCTWRLFLCKIDENSNFLTIFCFVCNGRSKIDFRLFAKFNLIAVVPWVIIMFFFFLYFTAFQFLTFKKINKFSHVWCRCYLIYKVCCMWPQNHTAGPSVFNIFIAEVYQVLLILHLSHPSVWFPAFILGYMLLQSSRK